MKFVFASIAATWLLLAGCVSTPPEVPPAVQASPVRFLLTFDDGPSIAPNNPTLSVLSQLANNDVQPGIKAIFFVQTRNANGGGSETGREILRQIHAAGHILGLHNADQRGHVGHLYLPLPELAAELARGKEDIKTITGYEPDLVRPPYFTYNKDTLAAYEASGYNMLLTDVSARDGVIRVFNMSLRRRSHLRNELTNLREKTRNGTLPRVGDVIPIVVTFHDVNPFTASHCTEYLHILVEEAKDVGLTLAARPFYDDTRALHEAALRRVTVSEK